MTAKAEIADYSIATRFGKGKRLLHDRKWTRPQTRAEAVDQIERSFRHTDWKESEQRANASMLGLDYKPRLDDYTSDELKMILADLEFYRMIIYED